uniref:transposase n=1 Tax=Streptomyces polyasparticus TaxID=2767826 RepID=UPI001BE45157|nr:transposase [Streptomyces polyasparticus]
MPPSHQRLESPYDPDARYNIKRGCDGSGYKIHLTEICDSDAPHLITHMTTTVATITDVEVTDEIHVYLADDGLLANENLVDRGYIRAALLATSQPAHGVELIGPIHEDVSWQGCAGQGFDVDSFTIDWENRQATCPQGHNSVRWKPHLGRRGHPETYVFFSPQHCLPCPVRNLCTRSKTGERKVTLGPREEHEAIRLTRQAQQTDSWKRRYMTRAGIEAAFGQGLRRCGLRRTRYCGLDKTRFQHELTTAALNIIRTEAWLTETPLAKTRTSRFRRLRPQ